MHRATEFAFRWGSTRDTAGGGVGANSAPDRYLYFKGATSKRKEQSKVKGRIRKVKWEGRGEE